MRYLQLWSAFFVQWLKSLLAYRVDFVIGMLSTVSLQSAALLTIWVVMGQVDNLNGWRLPELLLLYGLLAMPKALSDLFAANLMQFGRAHIGHGQMDRLLLRPVNPLFSVLVERFDTDALGDLLVGLALTGRALTDLGQPFGVGQWFYLAVAVVSGALIFTALKLMGAASAFWILDGFPINYALQRTHELAKYPLTIYQKGVRIALTWLLPFGFASYYPAEHLLHRSPGALAWLGPVVGLFLWQVAYRLWLLGLSRYTGAGS